MVRSEAMGIRLPGQKMNISPRLQRLFNQARTECNRDIKFAVISPEEREQFEGFTEWRDTDILIKMQESLDNPMAEYIAAHELCHDLQLARGYPIATARVNEPGAAYIAGHITDFVFDSSADAMAVEFGFPMASNFERWLKSKARISEVVGKPDGRRYGDNWAKLWERLEATRLCRKLGLKPPRPLREFWTLWVALDFANIIQCASTLGLTIQEVQEYIKRLPLLSRVVNDLLSIGEPGGICSIEESVSKLASILDYIKAPPGYIFIYKPLTDEIYSGGHWQPRPKKEEDVIRLVHRHELGYGRG